MADSGGLFSGASRVFTIPPGTDFLRALARTLAEEAGLNDKPDALADGEQDRQRAIGKAVPQRQQQQDAQRQRQLVERRHQPDLRRPDAEMARNIADDRVDVIGVRSDDRRRNGEPVFLRCREAGGLSGHRSRPSEPEPRRSSRCFRNPRATPARTGPHPSIR